jgi:hypothetical protein
MASDLGTIFGSGGLVISIISMIYAAINHKRIRAKCCGRSLDFEINIDSTEEADKKKGAAGTGLQIQEHQSLDVPTPTVPPSSKNARPPTPISFDTIRKIQLFGKKRGATIAPVAEDDDGSTHICVQPAKNPRKWVRDDADDDDADAELR